MEIKIREVNGEWALDIEMPDRIQVIYFASRQNALQVMHYLQLVDNIIKLDKKKLQTPTTNYDLIKAMSIDELAMFISGIKKFADKLAEMQNNTVHRYEVKDGEIPDICEIKLRDSGIDVDKIL